MSDFAFPASLVEGGTVSTVTAFNADAPEPVFMANSNHPNWTQILFGLRTGDPNVWDLFDIATGVMSKFHQISERYAWDGATITFDGDPQHDVFSETLLRALEEGNPANYTALAKFGEKLAANPSEHSRQQAYRFLSNHRFQITPDGDVVAYKSLQQTQDGDGNYLSGWSSQVSDKPSGYVNGKPVPPLSKIPQRIGDVVSMPRSEVDPDPNRSCSRGLHVATVKYWGGGYNKSLFEVHVNPRDFVAVPNGEDAKARVCRYYVAGLASPDTDKVLTSTATENQWVGDVGTRV